MRPTLPSMSVHVRRFALLVLGVLVIGGPFAIRAAVTVPNTFANGTTADAAAVNANFAALTSAINAVSCPTGFATIASQGRQLGCIQKGEQTAKSWFNATWDCWSNHGGRLPTAQEWFLAVRTFELIDSSMALTNTWGNWEWAADYGITQHSNTVVGFTNNTNMTGHFNTSETTTAPYRCFIDRR